MDIEMFTCNQRAHRTLYHARFYLTHNGEQQGESTKDAIDLLFWREYEFGQNIEPYRDDKLRLRELMDGGI